mmetsp:Transcript_158679/g.304459  ORF Transcript_158679/g.304459 Transcript_158679/m.304459 type:complete len:1518 (-) Transcript_158679:143-4696(-)
MGVTQDWEDWEDWEAQGGSQASSKKSKAKRKALTALDDAPQGRFAGNWKDYQGLPEEVRARGVQEATSAKAAVHVDAIAEAEASAKRRRQYVAKARYRLSRAVHDSNVENALEATEDILKCREELPNDLMYSLLKLATEVPGPEHFAKAVNVCGKGGLKMTEHDFAYIVGRLLSSDAPHAQVRVALNFGLRPDADPLELVPEQCDKEDDVKACFLGTELDEGGNSDDDDEESFAKNLEATGFNHIRNLNGLYLRHDPYPALLNNERPTYMKPDPHGRATIFAYYWENKGENADPDFPSGWYLGSEIGGGGETFAYRNSKSLEPPEAGTGKWMVRLRDGWLEKGEYGGFDRPIQRASAAAPVDDIKAEKALSTVDLASLRGSVVGADPDTAKYFAHFFVLLTLEHLSENFGFNSRWRFRKPHELVDFGLCFRNIKVEYAGAWREESKKMPLPGWPDVGSQKVTFRLPYGLDKERVRFKRGESVLISRGEPLKSRIAEGSVVEIDFIDPRLIVQINGKMPDDPGSKNRYRVDVFANRTTYERQVTALLEFVVKARSRICDMLVAAGVGKVDLAVLGGDGFNQDKDKLSASTGKDETKNKAEKAAIEAKPAGATATPLSIKTDGPVDEDKLAAISDKPTPITPGATPATPGATPITPALAIENVKKTTGSKEEKDEPQIVDSRSLDDVAPPLDFHFEDPPEMIGDEDSLDGAKPLEAPLDLLLPPEERGLCRLAPDADVEAPSEPGGSPPRSPAPASPVRGSAPGSPPQSPKSDDEDEAKKEMLAIMKANASLFADEDSSDEPGETKPIEVKDLGSPASRSQMLESPGSRSIVEQDDDIREGETEEERIKRKTLAVADETADGVDMEKFNDCVVEVAAVKSVSDAQRDAILNSMSKRLTIVQGPPGTGKTHTSVKILTLWAHVMGYKPVLATSECNIAVDNIAEGLVKNGVKVCRVGRPSKVREQLEEACLDNMVKMDREERRRKAEEGSGSEAEESDLDDLGSEPEERGSLEWEEWSRKRGVRQRRMKWERQQDQWARARFLEEAQVICATTITSGSNALSTFKFHGILVDEVAQATETSVIVPIVCRGAKQLVLCGDHCQLPPSVQSREAELRGFSLSLYSRLVEAGVPFRFLDTQYRAHPMLMEFSAACIYQGKLKNGIDGSDRAQPKGIPWPNKKCPAAFFEICEEEGMNGESKANEAEAYFIKDLVVECLKCGDLTMNDIGIVTPYKGQVRTLRKVFFEGIAGAEQASRSRDLEIASVDNFQGREKELIIFSAVRCNSRGSVGFLSDWRRLNVMITRARRGLVVVGNATTLCKDPHWKLWLEFTEKQGGAKKGTVHKALEAGLSMGKHLDKAMLRELSEKEREERLRKRKLLKKAFEEGCNWGDEEVTTKKKKKKTAVEEAEWWDESWSKADASAAPKPKTKKKAESWDEDWWGDAEGSSSVAQSTKKKKGGEAESWPESQPAKKKAKQVSTAKPGGADGADANADWNWDWAESYADSEVKPSKAAAKKRQKEKW